MNVWVEFGIENIENSGCFMMNLFVEWLML